MQPWSYELAGRLDEHQFESQVLKDNPLGDPHVRPLWVYVPPGYDEDSERRYPVIHVIQGLTGQVDMWRNRTAFRKNFPELVDEMFAREESPPCLLVFIDAWTSVGGSQFVDSPGTGRYHTYICEEIVPFVDANYRTLAAAERFDYLYSEDELGEWVAPLAELSGQADAVYAMFNNNGRSTTPQGDIAQAPVNAQMLRALLEREGLPVTPAPASA